MPEIDNGDTNNSEQNAKSGFDSSLPKTKDELSQDIKQALAQLFGVQGGGAAAIKLQQRTESYCGPLPHPKHLAEYRKDCPDVLERSLVMAERGQIAEIENSRQRLENERRTIEAEFEKNHLDSQDTKRGQYLGFLAFIFLIAAAVCLSFLGHDAVAALMVGSAVVGVISKIFIGNFTIKCMFIAVERIMAQGEVSFFICRNVLYQCGIVSELWQNYDAYGKLCRCRVRNSAIIIMAAIDRYIWRTRQSGGLLLCNH